MSDARVISILQDSDTDFHPVVPFEPGKDKLLAFDLTESRDEYDGDLFDRASEFTDLIFERLKGAGAKYGIGGYAEIRPIYGMSKNFNGTNPDEEPRRLHLGTDIWGKPNTAVMAPWKGIVHSFAYNDGIGDYGSTIILSHNISGLHFYSLYGHLSLNSLKNRQEGEKIDRGDIFADFGLPSENGHWPPHLHFQLILDIGEYRGDYPGVCKNSERDYYLSNCPDPDLVLRMNRYLK